jgi:hypothetical protein
MGDNNDFVDSGKKNVQASGHWHIQDNKVHMMTDDGKKITKDIKDDTSSKNGKDRNGHNGNGTDNDTALGIAQNTKEAIAIKVAEGRLKVEEIKALEGAKEVAGKHLAKAGAIYLLILVLSFIYSVQKLPNEAIAVVAGLITLVVTNLSTILKSITETDEAKDPIELMYDIAEKNSEVCQEEHQVTVNAAERQQAALVTANRESQRELITSFERGQREMVEMLRQAQEKQPTSLSIKPDDVIIQQGDNVVKTSTKKDEIKMKPRDEA